MEPNKSEINIDPDYEINNSALRKIEEKEREENKLTAGKLSKIIAEEFDKELSIRQKHLEELEEKICKAQKLLHLVRYVLVTSYYNKKNLDNSAEEESGTTSFLGAQNRIHPAVKKLLGNNASLDILNSLGKRKAYNKVSDNEASTSQPFTAKKIKIEKKEDLGDTPKCQLMENNQNSFNRKKTRHRIIIGNISKWMPSLENDNTTHKWMVYVRGLEETMDISRIIEKVVFFLHPSYKPHDVVEISKYPFHLARRGWGEFPLRVQIFFKCPLNKPVSIIHNLKLDKTYTGRQTLGNETVVDLFLHDDNFPLKKETKVEMCENMKTDINDISDSGVLKKIDNIILKEHPQLQLKQEPVHIKEEVDPSTDIKQEIADVSVADLTCSNFEHNYCHDEEVIEETIIDFEPSPNHNYSLLDHSYSLPHEEYNGLPCDQFVDKNVAELASQQPLNNLMYGLDDSYIENETRKDSAAQEEKNCTSKDKCVIRTFTTANGLPIRFLPQSFNNVLLSSGNVIQIKLLKQPQSNKTVPDINTQPNSTPPVSPIDYEKYKVTLPRSQFKNLGEALPYLFKRLSLWNNLAVDLNFKCTYPFVASSQLEYMSWNIGRKLSSEWSRARAIKKILSVEKFPYLEMWTTKTFFMYGRSHGYSPVPTHGTIFKSQSMEKKLLMSCFSESLPQEQFSLKNADDDIDVTADVEPHNNSRLTLEKSDTIDISDNTLKEHFSFVKEAALDCGVVLKSEEILEGVVMNAAERMIFEAVRCFAESLIRRSRHHLICNAKCSEEADEITIEEVKIALNERSELKSIMNFQRKKWEKDFFL